MKNDQDDIFDDPIGNIRLAQNAPAKLWRSLIPAFGVTPRMWNELMRRYLLDKGNGITPSMQQYVKGNMLKGLSRRSVTWRTFMRGLRLLEADKVEVYIVVHRGNRRTLHKTTAFLGQVIPDPITPTTAVDITPEENIIDLIERSSGEADEHYEI